MDSCTIDDGYILYLGGFLTEDIVRQRGLPTRNAAGSNRMKRISEALYTSGHKVILLSPATSLRPRITPRLFHPAVVGRSGTIPTISAAAIGIPFVSALSAFFFLPAVLCKTIANRPISAVIIYNYSPLLVLVGLWLRWRKKIAVFHNVEDVSIPQLADWLPKTEARPLQQLLFSYCMKYIANLSSGLIVPTKRFLQYLPKRPYLLISGCIEKTATTDSPVRAQETIAILCGGRISKEHGIDIFLDALKILNHKQNVQDTFEVTICGSGTQSSYIVQQCAALTNLKLHLKGFVSDEEYRCLLERSDICIALQNPQGRYATMKTPSKVYEYLGHGKAVIASNVGDLADIPESVLTICDPYCGTHLADILIALLADPESINRRKRAARLYADREFSYPTVGKRLTDFLHHRT